METITKFLTDKKEIIAKLDMPDKKKKLRKMFCIYCDENAAPFTVDGFKRYRRRVRGIFGFNLPRQRPKPRVKNVEVQLPLFNQQI